MNGKDLWTAGLFITVGLGTVVVNRSLSLGEPGELGPGFFPVTLGALLAVIGAAVLVRAVRGAGPGPEVAWWPVGVVAVALVGFAFLLRPAGLFPAVAMVSAFLVRAVRRVGWLATAATALGLAAGCTLVFSTLLGIPVAAFGTWFG